MDGCHLEQVTSASLTATVTCTTNTSMSAGIYIAFRLPQLFFPLFILTLVKRVRSRRYFSVRNALHCTSGQQVLLKLIRGFDSRIFWLKTISFRYYLCFMRGSKEEITTTHQKDEARISPYMAASKVIARSMSMMKRWAYWLAIDRNVFS